LASPRGAKPVRSYPQDTTPCSFSRPLAPTSHAAFNYKPTILRTPSLLSLFVVTIALIGLLQYAVIELPHGTSTRRDRLPGSSAARRDAPLLYARQASNSSGSAVTSASLPSITSSSITSAAITLTTAESAYLATDTTQTLSSTTAQAFTSNGFLVATSNYISTDATETVYQTSANTLFAVSQSDYVNAGTTQTVSLKSTIASSVGQSNYVSTDATQTVQTIAYSAAPSQYVSTDATQTITPSTSYTTVPSATVINVPVSLLFLRPDILVRHEQSVQRLRVVSLDRFTTTATLECS